MTLKDQLTADNVSLFFNTDEFAITATYHPKNGASRSIVVVTMVSPRTDDIGTHHETQRDTNQFSVPLDPVYGMTDPKRGDVLYIEGDPDPWEFLEVTDSDEYVIVVKFQKRKLQRAGHAVAAQL